MKPEISESQEKAILPLGEDQRYKLTRLICRSVCIAFALLETWSGRQLLNQDGISYLDMSDAFLRHNWHLLVNPLWSPLYPFLMGVATWLTHPSAQWEAAWFFPGPHRRVLQSQGFRSWPLSSRVMLRLEDRSQACGRLQPLHPRNTVE